MLPETLKPETEEHAAQEQDEIDSVILSSTPESRAAEDNAFTRFAKKYSSQARNEAQGEASQPCSLDHNLNTNKNQPCSLQAQNFQSQQNSQKENKKNNENPIMEIREPIDILSKIKTYKFHNRNSRNGAKDKLSDRIVLGRNSEIASLICEKTGAAYGLIIPSLRNKVFEFDSPFASLSNCRGIAQAGFDYLSGLNAQILSAVLITLADEYSLLSYRPSDSGAQKNAILRLIDREILIDSILFIENWVNSTSAAYIPKLSLLLDAEPNNMNDRAKRWLSSCVDAIYKPDRTEYDNSEKPVRTISIKATAAANRALLSLKKEYRAWKKEAKEKINSLYSEKLVSLKLKSYFLAIIQDNAILGVDPDVISLMSQKLGQLDNVMANKLGLDLFSFYEKLSEDRADDFFSTSFASQPLGSSLIEKQAEAKEQAEGTTLESTSSLENNELDSVDLNETATKPMINPIASEIAAPTEKPMSFTEKLLMKKKMEAQNQNENEILQGTMVQPATSNIVNNKGDEDVPF